jgi:hypothetical protein
MKFIFPFFFTIIISGCVVVTTNVQNAYIEGSARKSTIRISDDQNENSVIFRPYFNYSETNALSLNTGTHSNVDSNGVYSLIPVDGEEYYYPGTTNNFEFEGKNLKWNLPQYKFGLEIEMFYKKMAFILGANTSKSENSRFWGGNFGLAYSTRYQFWAWRFDFNVHFNQSSYLVEYATVSDIIFFNSTETQVRLLREKGQATHWNPEFSITFNSKKFDWPVNVYANLSFGSQTLFDIKDVPQNIGSISYVDNYSNMSLGLFKYFSQNSRLIIGARWNYHPDLNTATKYLDFILQYEIISME